MTEITFPSGDLALSAFYAPVESPKGLVQIIHGMIEHKERYVDFIRYLNEHGFAVMIADHRGHGKSVGARNPKLKILSLSGKDDRTTGGTKSLEATLAFLKQVGYEVSFKEYDHMKHEILLEDDREMVYREAVRFYEE